MSSTTALSRGGAAQPWWRRALLAQESGLLLVIVLIAAGLTMFGGTKPRRVLDAQTGAWTTVEVNKFLDIENIVLVAKDASFIAIMAVAMTAVIVMGGIDLSVGSIYALAALMGAMALRALQAQWLGVAYDSPSLATEGGAPLLVSAAVGIGVCCLVGAACGALNGALVVGLKVHPFVITLGTMTVLRGLVAVSTRGLSVSGFPESFTSGFFKARMGSVYPVPVLVMVLVAAVGHFLMTRTVLGRRAFAIGGNETAAVYAGVPVGRVKIAFFALMGMMAGLSAAVYLGYLGARLLMRGRGTSFR